MDTATISVDIVDAQNSAGSNTNLSQESREEDFNKLTKPRNNFASYSNDDISIRFRVSISFIKIQKVKFRINHFYLLFQNIDFSETTCSFQHLIESLTNRHSVWLNATEITPGATNFLSSNYEVNLLKYLNSETKIINPMSRLLNRLRQ